jgi:ribosomal protein S18 acetylase RimI-like enzyme
LEIRPFNNTLHDAQGILRVDEETFGDCHYAAEYILALETEPGQGAWVADQDDQIVGFASAFDTHSLEADRWEIDELAVRRAYQGQGIGTQLVAHTVSDGAPLPGLRQARALIARSNIASQRAFAKNGFAPAADVHLLLYQVSGRVPRPPERGLPVVRVAQAMDAAHIAALTKRTVSRVTELIARPENIYLVAIRDGTLGGCAELIYVRTLQYEGIWVESLSLAKPDRQVARALFRAAIERAKRHPGIDRVGYLAQPENRPVYETCVGEGFSQVDEYLAFVREVGSR